MRSSTPLWPAGFSCEGAGSAFLAGSSGMKRPGKVELLATT